MKTAIKSIFFGLLAAICLLLVTACNNDEPVDPYDINYVYIYSPSTADNSLEYKGNGTFLVTIEQECAVNPVRCTKPATEDLIIQLAIDPSLIDGYNRSNGTNYSLLKNARLENATLCIKKGEYISADSLKVCYTDMSEFQNGEENYILPITITSVSSSSVALSQSSKIYLTFSSRYRANLVTMNVSQYNMELNYENGGFTNLTGRWELVDLFTTSWKADDEISVSMKIDPVKVDTYNALNSTNFKLMPNATLEKATVVIEKGAISSTDPVIVTFANNMAGVELGQGYLLPITITKVDGIGASTGETLTVYLSFTTVEKITIEVKENPVGTIISDFTDWSITVNGRSDVYGVPWMNLVTDPGKGYISSIFSSYTMEINMGKLQKISSIQMEYYRSSSYSAKGATFEFSTDGINYKTGQCSMAAALVHNFVLKYPVETQYIRIKDLKSNRGTYPIGLVLYTQE